MGVLARNWRIVASLVFAVVIVGGAYELAAGVASPRQAQASTETAILQKLATRDSNGDGLPDWEKVLYGIPVNSTTTDYYHLGMTDAQAVARGLIVPKAIANLPTSASSTAAQTTSTSTLAAGLPPPPGQGTLTAAFAKNFLANYLAAKQNAGGAALSQAQIQAVASQSLSQLSAAVSVPADFKTLSDLQTTSSTPASLKQFAAEVAAISNANAANATTTELQYMKEAVNGDGTAQAVAHIASIAKMYRKVAVGMAALPVPQSLASADLQVINASARLSQILNEFTQVQSDPLTVMLALQQYPNAVQALGNGFIAVHQTYTNAGVTLAPGTPGASFVNLIPEIAAAQASSTGP